MPLPTVNCQLSTVNWTHTFSAKEKDTETGYSYFGSRYYSSDLSIWLSVDPMSDKYPSLSPYVYCTNNPVKLVDPNGEDWYEVDGKMHYTTEYTSKESFEKSGKEGEYRGKTYTKDGTYYSLFGDKMKANSFKGKLTKKIDEAFDKYANYLKKCEQTEGSYPEYQSSERVNFNDIISYNKRFGTTYENVHDEDPKTGAPLRYAYGSTIRFIVTGTRVNMLGRFRGFLTGNSKTTFGSGMLAKTGYNIYIVNGKNIIVGLTFSDPKNLNAFRKHFNKLYGIK
jgi:RHS repeat-associated protein